MSSHVIAYAILALLIVGIAGAIIWARQNTVAKRYRRSTRHRITVREGEPKP